MAKSSTPHARLHAPTLRSRSRAAAVRLGLLLMSLSLGAAGAATAGSLPEPIIDPTMGAVAAQASGSASPQTQAGGPGASARPSNQGAGGTPVGPSSGTAPSTPMPQRQLANAFQAPPPPSGTQSIVPGGGRIAPAANQAPPSPLEASLQESLQMLAMAGARQVAPSSARVEVELGRLDPRLRLAPCDQIQPYLPPNQRMWGRTRIGIRCLSGPTKWNVSLPLTIRVFAPAYVAVADLPVGTELTQDRLRLAETDIAGETGVIFTHPEAWVGRHLAKGLMAGEALRSTDLKLRQWVQPGDRVQVQAAGDGYAVSGEGQAMGVGLEGQDVRIRFDNGRMVTGRTVGERKVEVLL